MHDLLDFAVWGRKLVEWVRAEVPAEDDTDLWDWSKIFVLADSQTRKACSAADVGRHIRFLW
jgi:hypothetical protein